MPSEFGPADQAVDVRVAVSPVLDFQFGLFLLMKHSLDPEKWVPEWAVEVERRAPDLVRKYMEFWGRTGLGDINGAPYRECGELLVAGWHTGMLFSPSVNAFLDAVERAFETGFEIPHLPSEPAAVVELLRKRVAWLRANAIERAELMQLTRSLWGLIEPEWQRFGRQGAERAARDLATRVRPDVDVRTLVPGNNFVHKEAFQPDILAARANGELTIVPLGLAGGGQFYWAFPGMVLIGAGIDSAEREAKRRERAERAANKLKVLSDPTRVAILYELLKGRQHNPSTVTELASQFGLSQPTVSVHVKMLREAGLVQAEREGNQVFYRADETVIKGYIEQATDDLLQRPEAGTWSETPLAVPA